MILPPGTILQQMYFKERLRQRSPGRFVEVGAGQGVVSKTLLDLGWRGCAYDLNGESLAVARELNREAADAGRFRTENRDWLGVPPDAEADLVVSCMVIEHLDDANEGRYFERVRESLAPGGTGVLFVPASAAHWGIEDDIAGHFRRYEFDELRARIERHGLRVDHVAGLTYPVSNLLFPVSEYLVRRAERQKMALSVQRRTELSGNRSVRFKTTFPGVLRMVLNEVVMYPLHLLQKLNARNPRSMVIYAEFTRAPEAAAHNK